MFCVDGGGMGCRCVLRGGCGYGYGWGWCGGGLKVTVVVGFGSWVVGFNSWVSLVDCRF